MRQEQLHKTDRARHGGRGAKVPCETADGPYVSPKELAARWRCSRSQVDRIARRAGFTKLALGTGRNGIVRYLRKDVEALEASRLLRM